MAQKRPLLGIIGGMGAEAGAEFYERLIKMTPVEVDQDHIETILYSNSLIPDRTKSILKEGPSSYPLLAESAKLLERMGADLIVLTCVTSHHYIDDLRKEVGREVLSAVEETIDLLKERSPQASTVGVLATTGTIKSQLFQKGLQRAGLKSLVVPENIQDKYVMSALYAPDGIKAGHRQPARDKMLLALNWLVLNGAEAVISGCSEFPLLFNQPDSLVPLIDAMDALIRKTIYRCTGKKALESV